MKSAVALGLVVGLAACAGPRPDPPVAASVVAPGAWRDPQEPQAAVDAGWWTGFSDPVLSAIVEQALANNTDIAVAAGRVAEARGLFRLAQAQRLPNVTGAAAGARQQDVSPFGTPRLQTLGQAQLQVAYDVDLFGRLANASAAARESLLATEAARDNVELAVAAAAAGGYITLRGLDARLVVLRETLASREGALNVIRRRAAAGYGTMLDLRQAEADYHATQALVPAAELAVRRQEDGLSLLLGENPRAIERGLDLAELRAPTIPPGLPAALLRRRPDIAQAERQLAAADRTLDSVRAAFMPNIQLSASGGYVVSNILPDEIGLFALGGSVLAPIFDSGRLRAQQDIAVARRDQAAFTYRRTALNAFREVEDALETLDRNAEQERDVGAQRDALAEAYRLARNRYRAGYSPYLDLLEAQRGLLSADLQLVQIRTDALTAAVSLYQALGGGWEPVRPAPPPN